jgi:hypothetical protein
MAEKVPPPAEEQGWPVTRSESDELHRLRRDAESLGLAVTKIPERSRLFHEYGPYMLTDPGAGYAIVASGLLHLEDVEKWLRAHRYRSLQWPETNATPSASEPRYPPHER